MNPMLYSNLNFRHSNSLVYLFLSCVLAFCLVFFTLLTFDSLFPEKEQDPQKQQLDEKVE